MKLLYKGHTWGKPFDPCREFGCFQRLFSIVVDHFCSIHVGLLEFSCFSESLCRKVGVYALSYGHVHQSTVGFKNGCG